MRVAPRFLSQAPRWLASGLLLVSAWALAGGDGLTLVTDGDAWPRWQARLSVVSPTLDVGTLAPGKLKLGAVRLAGDRYFDLGRVGDGGGVRATSALLLGSASAALSGTPTSSASDTWATPYLGLGYSAWWSRAGLGLSADVGLLAQRTNSPALRLGVAGEGADLGTHAFQLQPVLQVNLSYAF